MSIPWLQFKMATRPSTDDWQRTGKPSQPPGSSDWYQLPTVTTRANIFSDEEKVKVSGLSSLFRLTKSDSFA